MHPRLRQPLRFPRDHRYTVEHASDYLDGDLGPDDRRRVEQHARRCPKCHELLATLRRTVSGLRELRDADPPRDDLAEDVITRLRQEP